MVSQHIGHKKGGIFSWVGELRLRVNNVILTDYTGWALEARIEDKDGVIIPVLTVEWIDEATGILRVRIPAADTLTMKSGPSYRVFITPVTPASEPLQPYSYTVSFQET